MSNSNLISIITPFFNSKDFFGKTFDSVLSQTYENWEWIIVDDCSDNIDSSFLNEIAKKDKRIKIIRNKERKGPAFCRNTAIKNAKGDYVAFLDSDDYWAKTKLEKQLNYMVDNNYDFTATYYNVYDERHERLTRIVKAPAKCTHRKLLRVNYIGCLTVMYKKSAFQDISIPQNIKKRNDYAIWLKLSEKTPCYVIKECLATYVRHFSNSVSSVTKSRMIGYHREMFEILYGYSKFKSAFCAFRNTFFYALKELFYVSNIKDDIQHRFENNDQTTKNEIEVMDNKIKCDFQENIYVAKRNTPVFKAILKESDLSPYTLVKGNMDKNLSTYLRVYIDVHSIGVFIFFFSNKNLDRRLLSQRIRVLKEQNIKYKIDAVYKTKDLFNILNDFNYDFAVYEGQGELFLKSSDFYRTNAKALIVIEN